MAREYFMKAIIINGHTAKFMRRGKGFTTDIVLYLDDVEAGTFSNIKAADRAARSGSA